ncbi:GntR family transcriptional regulator [Shinella sp. CPCC 100929]|uniref:GntR family transcriptional regulator n=2 Tax=Shinella TaxID=323620 RepID=A0ABT1R1C1_9HYPH|nr:GntR family transcriptional regulator [Shinella lacus]
MSQSPMNFGTKEVQIAHFLREGIISGRFPPGTRLKQNDLAEMLRTSITPIREALKQLAAEGYVEGNSYRGAIVAPFDARASAEVLNLRNILESELVREVVKYVTEDDLREVRELAKEFEEAAGREDSMQARGANYRFHMRLYQVAQMPQALHFVQILWARYPFDQINRISGRAQRAAEEHAELLRHIANRDVDGALRATQRHIETGWSELRDVLVLPKDGDATR